MTQREFVLGATFEARVLVISLPQSTPYSETAPGHSYGRDGGGIDSVDVYCSYSHDADFAALDRLAVDAAVKYARYMAMRLEW